MDLLYRSVITRMPSIRGGHAFAAFTIAWVVYDAVAPQGEMLTDAARRIHARYPLLWTAAVAVTATHLLDGFRAAGVPQLDPYTQVARAARALITRQARP
ncbi:DUF7427 family protein [Nocardia pseudobrasiliensis]|nr:hypothetical protein [Nocardia pseudobrasiliensis]